METEIAAGIGGVSEACGIFNVRKDCYEKNRDHWSK